MCGWVPRAGTRGSLLSLPVRLFAEHSPLSPGGFLQRLSSESPGQTPSAKEESPGCGRGRAPRHPLFMGPSLCFQLWSPGGRPHLHRGQCPEGPQPPPHPPQCCPSPRAPAGIPLLGPCRLPPCFCPFQLPRGGPGAGICRTRGSSKPVTDWKAASLGPAFPCLGSRPERAAGRPGAAAGSRPLHGPGRLRAAERRAGSARTPEGTEGPRCWAGAQAPGRLTPRPRSEPPGLRGSRRGQGRCRQASWSPGTWRGGGGRQREKRDKGSPP